MAQTKPNQSKWDRSDDYRRIFLKHNKGFFGCIYFCAYCGRPMLRKTMQVDHHLAVNNVKHNPLWKLWLGMNNTVRNIGRFIVATATGKKFEKLSGVNVDYNLLPACPKCNNRKSDKGGWWTVRGFIGGTIWKTLNAFNNLCLAIWSNNMAKVVIGLAAAIIILQFAILGTGPLAVFFVWLGNLIETFTVGLSAILGFKIAL